MGNTANGFAMILDADKVFAADELVLLTTAN
jgi:hypothetical protein